MTRPRLLNVRGIPGNKKFQLARGIPGYDEGNKEFVIGNDVLATQHAAYLAYARIQEIRGNPDSARAYLKKADDVRNLIETKWWDEKNQRFFMRVGKDHNMDRHGSEALLFWNVLPDGPKLSAAVADSGNRRTENLFKYGDPNAAMARLLETMTPGKSRIDYPEVPFSIIGNVVNGAMGINLEAGSALFSSVEVGWVAASVKTLPGLGTSVAWAELRNLPLRDNDVTVRHEGTHKTTFTNQHGPALVWWAEFPGAHDTLMVNGKAAKARVEKAPLDKTISRVRVTVGGGASVTVSVPE
jgi:hypothetical protein